ncbi:Catalase [Cellulomonas flavigena DSM 20109]|uniref:Catalase n=1 Tax=Cellulomonas flavigena (strain ATCC 482 / DSM 20109 / BCRC 11376 / JCM 18109 / NBRC 3775 / NCIMB 8073 / NRS 134) TaxID=446466 RepID=D5UKE6_CELFN|nr:catalase [Cellulomonas flavigena]ADG75807.1 Catalase [Cellulomonas flavigena DSM 20109]
MTDTPVQPGAPGSAPAPLEEPTAPREPLPPKAASDGPAAVSPTGRPWGGDAATRAQEGAFLTTAGGVPLRDTDHSLKAGRRGPTLLQDHHLREKITHFDHERIPERVVHARGAAAHGRFESYGTAAQLTCAQFLQPGVTTPVFTRFSTVVGSRGSADTVRDTRGFATKFYTAEGTFDLVGNNIPVFFIQDAIKFPDVVHAVKPHPDVEIPQAQSAHDTFWDFVSLHTEAQHHTIWNMSDRGIPRSYRTMEGFGVHTFRLVAADGSTSLVKFHWKPKAGVHSLTWEEAQLAAGTDPDFHRRDLALAIEHGAYPQWELGVQVFPDTEDQVFEGIDLLDPTKLVPEELAPVQAVGLLTLDRNPRNYFAETEQVAFHVGHLVRGIDVTDDPLLQGRLFSYLDTQLSRLGGPNFTQLPINRPHAPVNDMLRDGMHQTADHVGVAPYKPNTMDGGCPFHAGADVAFLEVPARVAEGVKERAKPASYDDHWSQVRMFWRSLTPVEQAHTAQAYTFELGRCFEQAVKERQLQALANVDAGLCATVAAGLGLPAPAPTVAVPDVAPSPTLSQVGRRWPVDGRVVGLVADPGTDLDVLVAVRDALDAAGVLPLVVAPTGGPLDPARPDVVAQRTWLTAASPELDALVLLGAAAPAPDAQPSFDAKAGGPGMDVDPRVVMLVQQAYRHAKSVAAVPAAAAVLGAAMIDPQTPGVLVTGDPATLVETLLAQLALHRAWERFPAAV